MGRSSTQTAELEIPCRLTNDELEEESIKLTTLITEKAMLEARKKATVKDFNEQIKDLEREIDEQVPIVADRQKKKKVPCEIEYNTPEPGKKTITRISTGETVGVFDMTDDEKQDMFYNKKD